MANKLDFITQDVDGLKEAQLFINIRTIQSPVGAWMVVDGKKVLNLCTNNYLGLAKRLTKLAIKGGKNGRFKNC